MFICSQDYNGPRTKKAISDFIVNSLPNIVKEVVSSDKDSKTVKNIDKFLDIKVKTFFNPYT